MITPADWLQARISKICDQIESNLATHAQEFPLTQYFDLKPDNVRDMEVMHGVVQNLVMNGWVAQLRTQEFEGSGVMYCAVSVDMPSGALHAHDSRAAAASWDALRERCAWFEQLYARMENPPQVGAQITGMRFTAKSEYRPDISTFLEQFATIKAQNDKLKNTVESIALALNLESRADEARIFNTIAQLRAPRPETDPELLRRRAWYEELGKSLHDDSPIKVGDTLSRSQVIYSQGEITAMRDEIASLRHENTYLGPVQASLVKLGERSLDDEVMRVWNMGRNLGEVAASLLELATARGAFPDEDEEDDVEPIDLDAAPTAATPDKKMSSERRSRFQEIASALSDILEECEDRADTAVRLFSEMEQDDAKDMAAAEIEEATARILAAHNLHNVHSRLEIDDAHDLLRVDREAAKLQPGELLIKGTHPIEFNKGRFRKPVTNTEKQEDIEFRDAINDLVTSSRDDGKVTSSFTVKVEGPAWFQFGSEQGFWNG